MISLDTGSDMKLLLRINTSVTSTKLLDRCLRHSNCICNRSLSTYQHTFLPLSNPLLELQ